MGRVVHFEIQADDLDRAERFYTTVFGWTVLPWSAGTAYRLLVTGEEGEPGINGALARRTGQPGAPGTDGWVCTVAVVDLALTEQTVTSAGGRQVGDRDQVEGIGWVSAFHDTEGNLFYALQPSMSAG